MRIRLPLISRRPPQVSKPARIVGAKLHIGCGTKRLPGFVHVDVRADVNPDVVSDVCALSAFESGSAELIYFCHGIEHLPRAKVHSALREWHRVLKQGGCLRLAVPDFGVLSRLYVQHKVPLHRIIGPIHGKQDYPENTHLSSWDFATLSQALTKAGFSGATRYDTRSVNPEGYADASYAAVAGHSVSLNVEASKA